MLLQRDNGILVFKGKPIEQWVLQHSFESLCFELFEPHPTPEESVAFHEQGMDHRARIAHTLAQKRPLFAPVMATLQSLASSLTVYQHDWAYLNQLLMSFGAFFQEEITFYAQFEQQLFVAGARQMLSPEDLPYVSALMNLWAIQGDGPVWELLSLYAQAQVEMPAAMSGAIALMTNRQDLSYWTTFVPWVESLAPNRLSALALKEIDKNGTMPGFVQTALRDPEKFALGKQIASQLAQQSEVFYPIYHSLLALETLAQSQGLSPRWEIYPVAAMHALGLYPNWLAPWIVFCQLPYQIAQYRLFEQEAAYGALRGETSLAPESLLNAAAVPKETP